MALDETDTYIANVKTINSSISVESIEAFLNNEETLGTSENNLRRYRAFIFSLYNWLGEDKTLTKERLIAWRADMSRFGYSDSTVLNYVKAVNRYLDFAGLSDIRFERKHYKDIRNQTFGYLTAIEPTEERYRKDVVWKCSCKCGNTAYVAATRLITRNTLSCGCLNLEYLKENNKYFSGTSLRQSLDERVESAHSSSGFTGVSRKRNKWSASITYQKKHYYLGTYENLEDAVKARARAKEIVMEDAAKLLEIYEKTLKPSEPKPSKKKLRQADAYTEKTNIKKVIPTVIRTNNTSGYPGVSRKKNKWIAKITYLKETYYLGLFEYFEDAVEARKKAESLLFENIEVFMDEYKKV